MYDTSPFSPLKCEIRQLWPEEISTKELESLFDLDPALEDSLDLNEFETNTSPAGPPPLGVPDSAVVSTPVDLLTLTAAATTEHLAQLESPEFACGQGGAFAAASPINLPQQQQQPCPSPPDVVTLGEEVLMPEFQSLVAMSTTTAAPSTTTTAQEWEAQAPFYTTVETEDLTLTSLTACSPEASLPGFTTTTVMCKNEPVVQDELSCSQFTDLSPRSTRSLSESSTSTTTSLQETPRRSSKGASSRRRQVPKGSEEYKEKRARNNVAVRKSRAKAKEKQRMTESRVKELLEMNDGLQKKVEMLTKELNVLKGLFINVGANLPDDFSKLMEQS